MTYIKLYKPLLFIVFALIPFAATAQDVTDAPPPNSTNKPADFRTNALRQLGLTRQQLQRIRFLNQERKPLMDAAQLRLRQANRSLDEIIYSDNAADADILARLKDFQLAQAEVAKIRFMNELSVRRILTPEQLTRFRQLRERFDQSRAVNSEKSKEVAPPQGDNLRPLQKFMKQGVKERPY